MSTGEKSIGGTRYAMWCSPVGWLGLVSGREGLVAIVFAGDPAGVRHRIAEAHPLAVEGEDATLAEAVRQLDEYFRGVRRRFNLPLDLRGLSSFAGAVLRALSGVPCGQTVTYGGLAALAGRPGAARAVGRVMAANPLPIVIPCHRVLGADGRLVGYSGGEGIATKERLLRFEAAHLGGR
jgi:methylated-DNA-[protein]-cysteine S-methyltransferase